MLFYSVSGVMPCALLFGAMQSQKILAERGKVCQLACPIRPRIPTLPFSPAVHANHMNCCVDEKAVRSCASKSGRRERLRSHSMLSMDPTSQSLEPRGR